MDVAKTPVQLNRLLAELREPDEAVQHGAVIALGRFEPPSRDAVPGLLALVRATSRGLRRSVWRTLERIDPDVSPPLSMALSHALHDPDWRVVKSALRYMWKCNVLPRVLGAEVVELLEHPQQAVRAAAAVVCTLLVCDEDDARELRAMRRALRDPDPRIRRRIAQALGRVTPRAVTPGLVGDLGARMADQPEVAEAAAESLARFGPRAYRADPSIAEVVLRWVSPAVDAPSRKRDVRSARWKIHYREGRARVAIHASLRFSRPTPETTEQLLLQMLGLGTTLPPSWRIALERNGIAAMLGWLCPRLADAGPLLVGLMTHGDPDSAPAEVLGACDAVPLAALMATLPGHPFTIAERERARQAYGDEFVAEIAALAGAFALPVATPAERLARTLAIIERGKPVLRHHWWPLQERDVLFDEWVDPFLVDALVEDAGESPEARRLLAWVADHHWAHLREVARAELTRQALAGERRDITHALRAIGRPQDDPASPERVAPHRRATLAGDIVDVALTFAAGSHYCCMAWGCHLPLYSEQAWRALRGELVAIGAAPEAPMRARVTVVIERDARFSDPLRPDPTQRGRHEYAPARARRHQHWIDEQDPGGLRQPGTVRMKPIGPISS